MAVDWALALPRTQAQAVVVVGEALVEVAAPVPEAGGIVEVYVASAVVVAHRAVTVAMVVVSAAPAAVDTVAQARARAQASAMVTSARAVLEGFAAGQLVAKLSVPVRSVLLAAVAAAEVPVPMHRSCSHYRQHCCHSQRHLRDDVPPASRMPRTPRY